MNWVLVMINKRKPIPTKLRFEVFKRDSFKCQYCGHSAPDALLQVDHINPVKRGGKNDIINLITSCAKCNMGKGATPLDDNTAMAKSKKQMDELNERRQQLEMMVKWKEHLTDLEKVQVKAIASIFHQYGFEPSPTGEAEIRKNLRRFGFDAVYDALKVSIDHYGRYHEGKITKESFDYAARKVGGICFNREKEGFYNGKN